MFAYLHIENNLAGISKFCFLGKQNWFGASLEKDITEVFCLYSCWTVGGGGGSIFKFCFCFLGFFLMWELTMNSDLNCTKTLQS